MARARPRRSVLDAISFRGELRESIVRIATQRGCNEREAQMTAVRASQPPIT